jgi:hypothetical protein
MSVHAAFHNVLFVMHMNHITRLAKGILNITAAAAAAAAAATHAVCSGLRYWPSTWLLASQR